MYKIKILLASFFILFFTILNQVTIANADPSENNGIYCYDFPSPNADLFQTCQTLYYDLEEVEVESLKVDLEHLYEDGFYKYQAGRKRYIYGCIWSTSSQSEPPFVIAMRCKNQSVKGSSYRYSNYTFDMATIAYSPIIPSPVQSITELVASEISQDAQTIFGIALILLGAVLSLFVGFVMIRRFVQGVVT